MSGPFTQAAELWEAHRRWQEDRNGLRARFLAGLNAKQATAAPLIAADNCTSPYFAECLPLPEVAR